MINATWTSLKRLLAGFLSLGLVALGVGCVGLALANIRANTDSSFEPYSTPTTRTVAPVADRTEPTVTVVIPMPAVTKGMRIGTLSIPSLKLRLPIIEGTDDSQLDRGVGHFEKSVMPGQADNCVLSGHRDTVFAGLGKLKKGELFIVETGSETFVYEITGTRIVRKNDRSIIVPSDHAILTVSTCYPFDYVGFAPDRYILVADLVTSE